MAHRRLQAGVIVLVGAAILVPVALFAIPSRPKKVETTSPSRALPVRTIKAEPVSSFRILRTYTGTIVAARTSDIAFERSGKVIEVLVDQGAQVQRLQELARLDTRHLLAGKRQLEANLRQATARLDELVAGPRDEQIAAAEAEVRNLTAQKRLQELNRARRESLLETNAIVQEEYDSAKYSLEATQAQLDAAQQQLNELRAGTRAEQIEAARAAVAQLEASLSGVEHDLEDCVLAAPFAGTVSERYVDEGAVLAPQTPVFRLVEDSRLEAWVGLPPDAARQISPGQTLTLRAEGTPIRGTATTVLPVLDTATRTRRVVVGLEENSGALPGQVVRLEVPEEIETTGFKLPASALVSASRGLWSCYVVMPDGAGLQRAGRRDIEVLHTSGEDVVVRGTLQAGEVVVAAGTHRVAHGQWLQVVAGPTPGDLAAHDPPANAVGN